MIIDWLKESLEYDKNYMTNEEMKKVYDAINSINMRISLISNNMVTERYMNSSKSKEGYYKEEFVKYMNHQF